MNEIPRTETITNFKNSPSAVLAKTKEKPVLLLQNSKPAVMLVAPEQWNATAKRIADLEALLEALRAREDTNPDSWMTLEEFEEEMKNG